MNIPQVSISDFVTWPFIDTLYDYIEFLKNGFIAELPKDKWGTEVAIIGAGAAGMVAAYELLKIGVYPVIYEASDRIGGRCDSRYFLNKNGQPSVYDIAEMGAMRFPSSSRVFEHYVQILGLKDYLDSQFPNPGEVPTKFYYENKVYNWPVGQAFPDGGGFEIIFKDWTNFINSLIEPIQTNWQMWQNAQKYGDEDMAMKYKCKVQDIWQDYINKYKDVDFLHAIREGIPSWNYEDMNKFGTIGIGTGGFKYLYAANFLEILRTTINQYEMNQKFLTCGVSKLINNFYTQQVNLPNGTQTSLQEIQALKAKTTVSAIEYVSGNPVLHFSNPHLEPRSFSSVIVATTTCSMEFMGLTLPSKNDVQIIGEQVKKAIRNIQIIQSSKLFIRTETKFWKYNSHIPQNIQTDELPRSVYTLDYPNTEHGIVLVSYVWGEDSSKLLALDKMKRLELFQRSIAKVSPEFAKNLVPMNGESDVLNIDWGTRMYYNGAFKLNYPAQEPYVHSAYYQFLSVNENYPQINTGIYLAGDSVFWIAGWIEGAFHTGLNAACAAAKHIGAVLKNDSPLSQNPNLYQY